MYGEGSVTDSTRQKWSVKFHARDFSLDDAPWSGRPAEVNSNQIETLTEERSAFYHAGDSRHIQNIQINSYW